MSNSRSRLICLLFVIVLYTLVPLGLVAAQEDTAPPPPVTLPEGHTYYNPHPGIVAPDTTDADYGTRNVTGARGYGDAHFDWDIFSNVTTYGTTWLNNGVPGMHYICARVITMDVNGVSVGSHSSSQCANSNPGGSKADSITSYVACGSFIGARTEHSISQVGFYSWGPAEDFDAIPSFCS